jgi:hypothetical protein
MPATMPEKVEEEKMFTIRKTESETLALYLDATKIANSVSVVDDGTNVYVSFQIPLSKVSLAVDVLPGPQEERE